MARSVPSQRGSPCLLLFVFTSTARDLHTPTVITRARTTSRFGAGMTMVPGAAMTLAGVAVAFLVVIVTLIIREEIRR
jgi:hypothetical protein